jgi:hypothetical protein
MTESVLLARMSSGAEWEDPSEDLLFELLGDIERGDEDSLTLERLDAEDHPKVRVARSAGGTWVADMDPPDPGDGPKSWTDMRAAHAWLTSWAFRIEDDRGR